MLICLYLVFGSSLSTPDILFCLYLVFGSSLSTRDIFMCLDRVYRPLIFCSACIWCLDRVCRPLLLICVEQTKFCTEQFYRKIHCLTSEFHFKFHAKNQYRTNREAMSATSVFRMNTTFISNSWRKQCLTFYNFQQKN